MQELKQESKQESNSNSNLNPKQESNFLPCPIRRISGHLVVPKIRVDIYDSTAHRISRVYFDDQDMLDAYLDHHLKNLPKNWGVHCYIVGRHEVAIINTGWATVREPGNVSIDVPGQMMLDKLWEK